MEDKFCIQNMNLYYGDFHALKDVSMNIPANEITAFIGPSGCGKSTFLKSLNRMNDLVEGCRISGSLQLDGEDIYGDIDVNHLRKRVGMVFQNPNPFPMSVYDNIAYGPRTHGIHSKAKLDEIVERSLKQAAIWDELKDRLKKSALGLSGGQQQRLCIARALAIEPEVILMDEPTSALDPISTSRIEDLVLELKDKLSLEDAFEQKLAKNDNPVQNKAKGAKNEAIEALVALGYSSSEALKALNGIEITDDTDVEDILKAALKNMAFM